VDHVLADVEVRAKGGSSTDAVEIVNGRPAIGRTPVLPSDGSVARWRERGFPDLYSVLGHSHPLPPDLERAFGQLLDGFHQLVRYMHTTLVDLPRPPLPESTDNTDTDTEEPSGDSS